MVVEAARAQAQDHHLEEAQDLQAALKEALGTRAEARVRRRNIWDPQSLQLRPNPLRIRARMNGV